MNENKPYCGISLTKMKASIIEIILIYLISGTLYAVPASAEFEKDGVSISVTVRSSIYTYKVTNHDSEPIVGFEIGQHAAYNFVAPDIWKVESTDKIFRAWTDKTWASIDPNQTNEFSMRVSSKGAVLGTSPVKIQFQSGKVVLLDNVWTPVKEPRSYVYLVAGVVFVLVAGHSIFVVYRKRRPQEISKVS
jgi:hypothetical protein